MVIQETQGTQSHREFLSELPCKPQISVTFEILHSGLFPGPIIEHALFAVFDDMTLFLFPSLPYIYT